MNPFEKTNPALLLRKIALIGFGMVFLLSEGLMAQGLSPRPGAPTLTCNSRGNFLSSVSNPPAEDRQAIMDLIHRFFWALDEGTPDNLKDLFLDSATYELCNAANQTIERKLSNKELVGYLADFGSEEKRVEYRTRHFESNTILNAVDRDTVEAKTAVLVTIQYSSYETPIPDYTATIQSTVKRDGRVWKIKSMVIITDGAEIRLRAR